MRYRTFGYDGDGIACYFYFIQWSHVSLGLHVSFELPNIEFHLPFGFIRIGRVENHGFAAGGWVWGDDSQARAERRMLEDAQ